MALATTTLSSAVTLTDTNIVVASASSVAAGRLVLVDQEIMQVVSTYVSGTTVGVLRGRWGTKTTTHVVTANVTHGAPSDFDEASAGGPSVAYQSQRARNLVSITATSTLTLPDAGTDLTVVLNGTSVITLTVPVPTKDMDGTLLYIVGNGAAAHLLTFTGGLNGAGGSYDIVTVNATAPTLMMVMACNGLWLTVFAPAMGGTVTNLIGSVA